MKFQTSETGTPKTAGGDRSGFGYKTRRSTRKILTHLTPDGVEVPVAEFAIPADGTMKVTHAVSNLGHDELMQLRRKAKGKRPPLSGVQRKAIYNRKMAQKINDETAGVRTPEERLQVILNQCQTVAEKQAVIEAFKKTHGATIGLSAPAVAAELPASPAPEVHDIGWLYRTLMETRDALARALIGPAEAAEARMTIIRTFDIQTCPDRDMLETLTGNLVGRKNLLTKQEREMLVNRAVQPAPTPLIEDDEVPVVPPPGPVAMDPAQFGLSAKP